jgi:transcription elongation regulator 1
LVYFLQTFLYTIIRNHQAQTNKIVYFRCVVWTGDGRVFFYNPSSRTSVWERPEDLVGRADVDKMVASPPDAPNTTQASTGNSNNTVVVTKRAGTSIDSSDEDHPTPSKKPKKDDQPVKGMNWKYLFCLYLQI